MKNILIASILMLFTTLLYGQDCTNCFDDGPLGCGKLGYYDGDGDGFGTGSLQCFYGNPSHYARKGGDCNDGSSSVYPRTFYVDNDGDGYGAPFSTTICQGSATPPSGYADNNDDCDDGNSSITFERNWYQDSDGDSFGDPNTSYFGCAPQGLINPVTNNSDYDDSNQYITDVSPMTFYYDGDGDTFGVNSNTEYRSYPSSSGYVAQGGDCNDSNTNINPDTVWYLDADGDGLGVTSPFNKVQCMQPPNDSNGSYVLNNSDLCPNENGPQANNGCLNQSPLEVNDSDKNYVWSIGFDIDQNIKQNGIDYYDELGKIIQSQKLDAETGQIWARQTLYDSEGRAAFSSFGAPIGINGSFQFKNNFISKTNGDVYQTSDYESNENDPAEVGEQSSTLGWYYSNNNTNEPYQDITDYPFARTIFSKFMPNVPLKTFGGNKINGEWPQAYVFTMRASRELSQSVAFGNLEYDNYKILKTVSRDVHGAENVVFTDSDGLTLAGARSGGSSYRTMNISIDDQGYVDIHVPAGNNMGFTVSSGGNAFTVYNLITESVVSASTSLPNGFYRVAVNDADNYNAGSATVTYRENYYDYSLNVYDEANRLVESFQPIGSTIATKPKTTYNYDAKNQLVYVDSPDEGKAWFKYRNDGQIRYSRNSKQLANGEVSYTEYDPYGRPIESGVVGYPALFEDLVADDTLPSGPKSEVALTKYDNIEASDFTFLNSLPANYRTPTFLSGNVSKTVNTTVDPNDVYSTGIPFATTYYSYDIYGRVKWLVQDVPDLGAKTIDYEYHPVTGLVTRVIYQQGASDQFIHRYSYNILDQLTLVETSSNGSTYFVQAAYDYYESGELKRMELANGAQGVDYVYNLDGRLKAINHPTLAQGGLHGTDSNTDLFGMQLDYHGADYQRSNPNIGPTVYGQDQLNGNIKGIRWNNKILNLTNPNVYTYEYDRNNWLTKADFGIFLGNGNSNAPSTYPDSGIYTSSSNPVDRKATQSITLEEGFHAQSGSTYTARIVSADGFEEQGTGDYDVSITKYDANGNIIELKRNKDAAGGNAMDDLTYRYGTDPQDGPNQLIRVDDATYNGSGDAPNADDITDQDGNNYNYNEIGQLIRNNAENIDYFYNASGLVTQVDKDGQPAVKFFYNDRNHRVKKESFINGSLTNSTFYVRDVAGQVMAIYSDYGGSMAVAEQPIYGAGRIGVAYTNGSTVYELTDHLGNVRALFTKENVDNGPEGYTDYYPFGMPMPSRQITDADNYRYAFQGQEKDPETEKEAFELRLWDSRIGRWLTTDPAGQYASPYLGMGNNPMIRIDPDGGRDSVIVSNQGIVLDVFDDGNKFNRFFEEGSGRQLYLNDPDNWDFHLYTAGFQTGDRVFNQISFSKSLSIIDITNLSRRNDAILDVGGYFNMATNAYGDWDYTFSHFFPNKDRYGLSNFDFETGRRFRPLNPEDNIRTHFVGFRFGNQTTIYNVWDAGNFLWGLSAFHAGYSHSEVWIGSNLNEFYRGGDDAADQRAIFNGYRFRGN